VKEKLKNSHQKMYTKMILSLVKQKPLLNLLMIINWLLILNQPKMKKMKSIENLTACFDQIIDRNQNPKNKL